MERNAAASAQTHMNASKRVIVASTLGTTLEFYDFIVYGTVAALVFNDLFFPSASPATGTLLALSTFAVGFLARPIGAAIFGHLGDRIGRRKTLMLTLTIMGVSTVLIGCLPTFAQVGIWAPVLLVTLRILQGAAVGGEWGGAVLLIGEHAGTARRGRSTSFAQLGSPAGLLLANGTVLGVVALTTEEQFAAWGWRVPFLLSVVLVAVGVYLRLRVEETPVFQQLQREQRVAGSPVVEVFRGNWRQLLIGVGVTVVSFGGYYVFTTVGIAYLALQDAPSSFGLYGTVLGAAVALPVILLVGAGSDRFGRRPFYAISAVLMGAWAFAFFPLLDSGVSVLAIGGIAVGVVVWAMLYGVQGAFLPELFPAGVRYTGSSLAYQITGALGGFVPVISLSLLEFTESAFPISVLVLGTMIISLVFIKIAPEPVRRDDARLEARSEEGVTRE
ncbi:MFS transporter [Pseudonocardia sichuanensis]